MSFRARLTLTSLLVLVVGLGAVLVAGNVLLARRVEADASDLLRARVEAAVAAIVVTDSGIRVRNTLNDEALDKRSWVLAGDRVVERPTDASAALDRAATGLGRARRQVEREGPNDIRLRAEPVYAHDRSRPTGAVVVALSTTPLERLQQEVLVGSLVMAALILLAGGVAIRSAVNGALRPVREMTAAAEDWGAHDLDRRFDLGAARDELTSLAATLDGLLARIAASRRHEQRFASEMAHELRTPIATLRARAELALTAGVSEAAGEREGALRAVVAQADRLEATIDTLLAVARRELDPAEGSVDLAVIARELEADEVIAAPGLPAAEGEPDVVRRALAPLVDNARRHARSRVWIELSATDGLVTAAVHDDGPGLDPGLGEAAFEPGTRRAGPDARGAGLGLPLARRLARSCGGDIVVGPGPGGCFLLQLPALGRQPS